MRAFYHNLHPAAAKLARMTLVFLLVFWSSFSVETLVAFGDDKSSGAASSAASSAAAETPAPQPPAEEEEPSGGDEGGGSGAETSDNTGTGGNSDNTGGNTGGTTDDNTGGNTGGNTGTGDNTGTGGNSDNTGGNSGEASGTNPENSAGSEDPKDDKDKEDEVLPESDRYNISKHKDGTLTNVEMWSLNTGAGALDRLLSSAASTNPGTAKLSSNKGELTLVAVPHWKGDTYNADNPPSAGNADFVDWNVTGDTGSVEVTQDKGRLKVVGKSAGEVTVTFRLKGSFSKYVSESFSNDHPGKAVEATVNISVLEPYISSMEILKPNGEPCSPDQALQLTTEELKSYAFQVSVRTHDQATDATNEGNPYIVGNGKSLKEVSEGLFEDVKWEVLDKDGNPAKESVAKITDDGVFTMVGDLEKEQTVQVRCTSNQGLNGSPVAPTVVIGVMPKADIQGEPHPQDSLHVVSNAVVPADAEKAEGDAEATEGETEGTSTGSATSGSSASAAAPSADAASGSSESAEGSAEAQKATPIDKTYSVSDLENLGVSTTTATMSNAQGSVTVTGEGASLTAILTDAGITDFSQVLNVEFVDYRGVSTAIEWSALEAAAPVLAARSYVHEPDSTSSDVSSDEGDADKSGDAAKSSDAAATNDDQLLDNTRFRLIGSGVAADADALRYINEIRVNLRSGEGGDKTDSELKVYVEYVPVPLGDTAVLSAVLNQAIGNGRFSFQWQSSEDGTNWTDVSGGAVQTLRVTTNDDTLGDYYRVKLETNLQNEEGANRGTVSDPVKITEGNGFFVQLAYDPPIAGETAIFQAVVKDTEGKTDLSKVEYVWEQSSDGGDSWTAIPNAKSSMLSIPTKPVSENTESAEEGGEGEGAEAPAVTLIYIRVRAIAPDGRVAVSNAQPLTAHVGGAGKDPEGGDEPGKIVLEDPEKATAPDLPKNEDQTNLEQDLDSGKKDPAQSSAETNGGKKTVTLNEVPTIRSESTPRQTPTTYGSTPTSQSTTQTTTTNQEQPTQPSDQAAQPEQQPVEAENSQPENDLPSELIINPEISALIQDQKTTVDRALDTSRPGARWTQISAVDPTPEQIRNILADNPFAPFVMPVGLGVVVAGGVEKLLAFRRQKRS